VLLRLLAAAALAAAVLVGALAAGVDAPPATAQATTPTSTTLPVDSGDRSVIPAPNTGRKPTNAGDPGGWAQLALFGIMAAGSLIIFGRVLWAGHQRSRANQVE
jgi:hypothetical protein